jgi:putative ABC transport system substrate-binding protein
MIDRRRFVVAFAGSLVLVPPSTSAQQDARVYRIGVLGIRRPSAQALAADPFMDELRRRGYAEGRNLLIEGRHSGGDVGRLEGLAAELVALNVDVIVTFSGTPGVLAAKKATSTIPIVMMTSADPVDSGIVASLARPGGNITGNAIFGLELAVKRLEILTEVVGKPSRIAYLVHRRTRTSLPHMEEFITTVADAAHALGT